MLNYFQVLLSDRSDIAAGDFDIEFNYDQIKWETGQASGGDANCQGGSSARVGYSKGTGEPGTFFELPGSGVPGSFLDSNLATGLIHNSLNSTQLGRYVFRVRSGVPIMETAAEVTGGGQIALNGGGRASFGFLAEREEDHGPVSGNLNYLDHDSGLHINGPVDDIVAPGTTGPVTFSGTACGGTCTFTVTVEDKAEAGKNVDTFEIEVSGSINYSVSPRTISRGNIQRDF